MSQQATAELLSAYLDGELSEPETRRLEEDLERDPDLQRQLEGMRHVVSGLRRLERSAPPSTLDQLVARRIALAGEERGLFDRIESGLSIFNRQSSMMMMFALVIALVVIVLLFLTALEGARQGSLQVVFTDPADLTVEHSTTVRRQIADTWFVERGEGWVEDGLSDADLTAAVPVVIDSEAGQTLVAERPELANMVPVVIRDDQRIVELRPSTAAD